MNHLLGGLAALGSAALFSLASILFRRLGRRIDPASLNFAKGAFAVLLTAILLLLLGMEDVPGREGWILALSGILGITIGDTAYFGALNRLGARRTLVLDALLPAITAGLAMIVLGERLTPVQWGGVGLTLGGVTWVLRERVVDTDSTIPTATRVGVALGLLAIGCHAVGVILSKDALAIVPALEASLVRQATGLVGLGFYLGFRGQPAKRFAPLTDRRTLGMLMIASFLGTFLGIWLALLGLEYTSASVATTLNATGPIWVLPLAWLIDGERSSPRAILGSIVAVAGVAVLLMS